MKKKGFRIKTLSVIACCIVMLLGFVLLCFAVYYQQRLVEEKECLSTMVNKPMPREYLELVPSLRRKIPLFATIGIMLCGVGGFLLLVQK